MTSPLAELRATSKRYGPLTVVDQASLSIQAGSIHVIAGENGAGKSTVLRILAGLVSPDAGDVRIGTERLRKFSPRVAKERGVALVAQHFSLLDGLSALENVVLSAPPHGTFGDFRESDARARVEAIVSDLGAPMDLARKVESLGVGERQRLEIARALFLDAKVLLLDEPTAVLTVGEADTLYALLRRLADAGRGVVVVSHKLDEIRRFADAVTVLRRGKVTLDERLSRGRVDEGTMGRIERAILGEAENTTDSRPSSQASLGEEVVRLEGVHVGRSLVDVSLTIRRGEILGIAGVSGNGQEELVRLLAGERTVDRGTVLVPSQVAVVHEDRHREGLCLDVPLRDNVLLGEYGSFSRHGLLDVPRMQQEATRRLEAAHVRGASPTLDLDLPARALSGGNQQKVVCARAFAQVTNGAPLLVLAHPTRGVDLRAARTIRDGIRRAAHEGAAILLVSADPSELRALSTRLLVFFRGRASELPTDFSDETLGHAMLGEPS